MKSIHRQILSAALMTLIVQSVVAQFNASINLVDIDGSNGFTINGVAFFDNSGWSVSHAGDVNGDGIDDVIIGAWGAEPNGIWRAGSSYVVFGSTDGFSSSFDLSSLDGSNGFIINGVTRTDHSGSSVSYAGDVNGDGIDDMIIGAPGPNNNTFRDKAGTSYVIFGSNEDFSPVLELSSLDGNNGFSIIGVAEGDNSGVSVSYAGDFNGDDIDDVIIGARSAASNVSNSGSSYVIFGSNRGFTPAIELSSLNSNIGLTINGAAQGDNSGVSVSHAGDVNGDGIDDVIIGAWRSDSNGFFSGSSHVVFGSKDRFLPELELSSLDGSNGFTINGAAERDNFGRSVSYAGDVNGDGIDDVIIGAYKADPNGNENSGSSYVIFGNNRGFMPTIELSSLDGSNGFTINGASASDQSGVSVSHAGDVNGDGIGDVIIGAPISSCIDGVNCGSSHVVFGSEDSFTSSIELSSLNGSNGFSIIGISFNDQIGQSVSNAGDVNGDGIDDVIIGAPLVDSTSQNSGSSYVVYGRENPLFKNGFE